MNGLMFNRYLSIYQKYVNKSLNDETGIVHVMDLYLHFEFPHIL